MPIRVHRIRLLSLALAAALGACAGARAGVADAGEVLLHDDFDGENDGRAVLMYGRFRAWTVVGGTVDLVGARSRWDFQPGHGLYVDLDGDRPNGVDFEPGKLVSREPLRLEPGEYELRFRLAGSQRGDTNTTQVRLGDAYREMITRGSREPFYLYVRNIPVHARQEALLSFDNAGADGFGLLLDDVTLRRIR